MDLKKKLIIYPIYLIAIYGLTIVCLRLGILYFDIFVSLFVLFSLFNLLFSSFVLKLKLRVAIFASVIIAGISLFTAVVISANYLVFSADPYGVVGAVIANGLISVMLWEVVYQLYQKIFVKSNVNR